MVVVLNEYTDGCGSSPHLLLCIKGENLYDIVETYVQHIHLISDTLKASFKCV